MDKNIKTLPGCLFTIIACIVVVVVIIKVNENKDNKSATSSAPQQIVISVIDSTEFSGVSAEVIVEKMGEPGDKETWNYTNADGRVDKVTTYGYTTTKAYFEFLIVDDRVVRLNVNSLKYWTNEGANIRYGSSVLSCLGITASSSMQKVADTGYSLRYETVATNIYEVLVSGIDATNKTFETAKITYDSNYFN